MIMSNRKEGTKTALKELAQMVGIYSDSPQKTSGNSCEKTQDTSAAEKSVDLKYQTLYKPNSSVAENKQPEVCTTSQKAQVTIIAEGSEINGNINATGDVEIKGFVQGDVETDGKVFISGKLFGNVKAVFVQLSCAQMQGNISTQSDLIIDKESILMGDVTAKSIVLDGKLKGMLEIEELANIETNAVLDGNVKTGKISISQGALVTGEITTQKTGNTAIEFVFDEKKENVLQKI